MDCPRCGDDLERYVLEGRQAVTCAACGYIGVPVEHGGEYRAVESWAEALARLTADPPPSATTVTVGEPTSTPPASDGRGDGDGNDTGTSSDGSSTNVVRIDYGDAHELPTCDVCGKAFDSRQQLHGHSAVHADDSD